MTNFVDLWVYLSGSPLLWLTTTLIAYLAADAISARNHCYYYVFSAFPEETPGAT
jgi:hypothetical protein